MECTYCGAELEKEDEYLTFIDEGVKRYDIGLTLYCNPNMTPSEGYELKNWFNA